MALLPDEMVNHARTAYASPGRAYHTWEHVEEVLQRWDEVARDVGWQKPKETRVALLYHDAVYVPGRHDNEEASAELARAAMVRYTPDVDASRVADLILLTAKHGKLGPADVDGEAALFLDCDMAILGAESARFDDYERAIAVEYSVVPPELYAAGRRRFLETLLQVPRIFCSDYFHARLDRAARDNLRRALGALA
jgi:predicted metal-dependent HD superfamily phosphohydrolase